MGEAIVCVKGDRGWLNRMVSERKVLADSARLVYLAHRTSQAERARFTAAEAIKKRKAIACKKEGVECRGGEGKMRRAERHQMRECSPVKSN